jgi:hypothetical protein
VLELEIEAELGSLWEICVLLPTRGESHGTALRLLVDLLRQREFERRPYFLRKCRGRMPEVDEAENGLAATELLNRDRLVFVTENVERLLEDVMQEHVDALLRVLQPVQRHIAALHEVAQEGECFPRDGEQGLCT